MAYKIPHPGQLRHRVEIGQTTNIINANGYPVKSDAVICSPWAGIADGNDGYGFAANADNAESKLIFIIRHFSGISAGMWVAWQGKKYRIESVSEYDFRQRYLRLEASALERGDGT